MGFNELKPRGGLWLLAIYLPLFLCLLTGSAPATSPTSVTLTWTAPGDDDDIGTAAEYDLRYSLEPITEDNWNSAEQANGEPSPQPAGSAETFEVTGLQPGTSYYFAIKTADEIPNWSELSNVIARSTLPEDTPPGDVSTLVAGTPTQATITLGWLAPGDDGSSGTASQYDIRYSTATITSANWDAALQASGEPSPQTAGTPQTFIVTGLDAGTTYYFALKTADEVPNWSGLSNIASATTEEEPTVPDAPLVIGPDNGVIDLVQPVDLSWVDVGEADMYRVQLDDNADFGSIIIDTTITTVTFAASGLDDGLTCYWRVAAHNDVGWGDWSSVRSFTTVCPLLDPPSLASPADGAVNVTLPIALDWTDVASILQYRLQVDDQSDFSSLVTDILTSGSAYTLSGLAEATTYYWRVRSNNACGSGAWSAVQSFTTRDNTLPTAISNLVASAGNDNGEIILTWTATGDDGTVGTASQYDIRYAITPITLQNWDLASQVSGEPSPQTSGTTESFAIGNLNPNQTYYFAIKVVDEAGNWSGLSNVAGGLPADLMPPAKINDLGFLQDFDIEDGLLRPRGILGHRNEMIIG